MGSGEVAWAGHSYGEGGFVLWLGWSSVPSEADGSLEKVTVDSRELVTAVGEDVRCTRHRAGHSDKCCRGGSGGG